MSPEVSPSQPRPNRPTGQPSHETANQVKVTVQVTVQVTVGQPRPNRPAQPRIRTSTTASGQKYGCDLIIYHSVNRTPLDPKQEDLELGVSERHNGAQRTQASEVPPPHFLDGWAGMRSAEFDTGYVVGRVSGAGRRARGPWLPGSGTSFISAFLYRIWGCWKAGTHDERLPSVCVLQAQPCSEGATGAGAWSQAAATATHTFP